jgi:hypothetical protein
MGFESKPNCCPFCGDVGYDIDMTDYTDDCLVEDCVCLNCGKEWLNIYVLEKQEEVLVKVK